MKGLIDVTFGFFSSIITKELHEAYRGKIIPGEEEFFERLDYQGRINLVIRDLNELHASPLCDQFDEHLDYRSRLMAVIRELDELQQALYSVPLPVPLQPVGTED